MEDPVIEVRDLVRKFGNRTILNGISFTVEKGDTMIIMGSSGCGESAVLRHIIGSLRPTSSTIKIFGRERLYAGEGIRPVPAPLRNEFPVRRPASVPDRRRECVFAADRKQPRRSRHRGSRRENEA